MSFLSLLQLPISVTLLLLFLPLLLTRVDSQDLEDCISACGGVDIPYPFGIGDRCAKDRSFVVRCNHTSGKPSLDLLQGDDREIVSIDLHQGEITLINIISTFCVEVNETAVSVSDEISGVSDEISGINLSGTPFTFSTSNKLVVTGCATTAFLSNGAGAISDTRAECSTLCSSLEQVRNDACSGIGCCQSSINKGLKIFNVSFRTFYGKLGVPKGITSCSRAFIVEEKKFNFITKFLTANEWSMSVQMVLDFSVDVCGNNSNKNDSSTGVGHRCSCLAGYEGNPYIPEGCTDIDECKQDSNPCPEDCINTPGGYKCTDKSKKLIAIISALSGGLFLLLFGGSSFFFYKKSKKIQMKKLRKKYFNQNHILLEQTLLSSSHEDNIGNTKFFTLKELEKATNNFDKARIIGEGGHGTVYKGLLLDQRVAAIKTSKVVTQREIEEYINEVALLSRTYHRNVVKLLGCCLESEVPLLVYEYIFNGTLSNHLHHQDHSSYLCWDDRLRIATEVAAAIVYLLSASSNIIFHRDLKSANILLDGKLTAKLSDFGASKSISSSQTHVTTTVQGTIGYLDPEYYQSGKLTEKSDVYSFGVILVELLTGEKPISKGGNVIMDFINLLKENKVDQIFHRSIVEESVKEELDVVASLAGDCLRLRGEDRPTMKEIESTLDGIRRSKKKQIKGKINQEEQLRLLSYDIKMVGDSGSPNGPQSSQEPFSTSQSFNSFVHLYKSVNPRV